MRTSAAQANFSGWTAQLESILVYLVDATSWKGLVARADAMVYRAKAQGRGRREVALEHPQPDTAGEVQAG